MDKWQIVDYIYWNRDRLTEGDIWQLVDSISDRQALEMIATWLYRSSAPGAIHIKAQGIIEWYQQKGFITTKQRRWLVMAIICHWDTTSCQLQSAVIL